MKNRITINYKIIYVILVITGIIIIAASGLNPGEKNVKLIEDKAKDYNYGWEYRDAADDAYISCTLPLSLDKSRYKDLILRKKMQGEARDGQYLMYRSTHAENHIFVDDKEIYAFGDQETDVFPLPGSAWIVIPLKDEYNGKYIEIDLHRIEQKYGGIMGNVIIGDRADMLERIIVSNTGGVFACFMIFFVSIILFVLGVAEKRFMHNRNLFYLAAFSMGVFLWSINETHTTQLFIGNVQIISIMSYEILALLSMPIVSYYSNSRFSEVRNICNRIAILPVIDFILVNVIHFTGFLDLSRSLILTHITIFSIGICIAVTHIRAAGNERRISDDNSREVGYFGFIALVICVGIDIARYYSNQNFSDHSRYSRIGLLLFVIFLAADTVQGSIRDEIDLKKAEVYKSVAFTDTLTGLGNRQAYELEVDKIDERDDLLEHLVVAILDLNNLKKTNDSMGHAEGDRYIISSADFINGYFKKIAKVYRIGGDEFAILFTGHDSDVFMEMEANMFDDIMTNNRSDLNFAYGSAVFNHITDRSAADTIRRADAKMYDSKRKYKHTMGEAG